MSLLSVQNLGKSFRGYSSEWKRFASWFGIKVTPSEEHWVLRNINFEIEPGEALGIIGQNGAGKSTLLKLITGTLRPTEGRIQVNGRIAAILELGMGFNPEFTGRQNVIHAASLMGFTSEKIQQSMPDIEAFAEVGEYFDEPLRTYSSGMQMRVAFSLVTARQPDLLIIDEALSVGDAYFQQKCMKKIQSLKNNGVSVIFVSHDINSVKMLCDKAILIDGGLMIDKDEPREIIKLYRNMTLKKSHQGDLKFKQKKVETQQKQGNDEHKHHAETGEVELLKFSIRDVNDQQVNYVVSENILRICFTIRTKKHLEDPHFGIIIRNKFGISAFETNTYCMHIKSKPLNAGGCVGVEFNFACNLAPADYSVSIGVANKGYDRSSFKEYLLFMQDLEMLKIIENGDSIYYSGHTNLNPTFKRDIN